MYIVGTFKATAANTLIFMLSFVILMAPAGCATTRKEAYPPPLSKESRSHLGTIGVAHADYQPEIWLGQKPLGKGQAAWEGTKEGAGTMLELVGETGSGGEAGAVFAVLFVVLSVFAGATGLVVGAAEGVSEEDVKKAEADLVRVLPELNIQGNIRDALLDAAERDKHYRLVPIELAGTDVLYAKPDYESLSRDGIDTLLRIGVVSLELSGEKGINPELHFKARVLVRLERASDGGELYYHIFNYSGKKLKFCDWAEDSGRPLREEFDNFYRITAEKIVERLFVMDAD